MIALLESARLPKPSTQPMLPRFRKLSKLSQPSPPEYTPSAPPAQESGPKFLPPPPKELQIIENRYIDHDKLLEFCKERFGLGNYQLQYKSKKYYLKVPTLLDEDTLEQCEIYVR